VSLSLPLPVLPGGSSRHRRQLSGEVQAEDAADTLLTIRLVLVVPPLRRAMCWQTQRPLSAVVFALVGMAVLVVGLFVTVADEVCGDSTTSFCVAVGASG
jgi:hypothetical protein